MAQDLDAFIPENHEDAVAVKKKRIVPEKEIDIGDAGGEGSCGSAHFFPDHKPVLLRIGACGNHLDPDTV
jgi:hypothetical protein